MRHLQAVKERGGLLSRQDKGAGERQRGPGEKQRGAERAQPGLRPGRAGRLSVSEVPEEGDRREPADAALERKPGAGRLAGVREMNDVPEGQAAGLVVSSKKWRRSKRVVQEADEDTGEVLRGAGGLLRHCATQTEDVVIDIHRIEQEQYVDVDTTPEDEPPPPPPPKMKATPVRRVTEEFGGEEVGRLQRRTGT